MLKRSLSIAGHRTSIALEPQFWEMLEQMATERGQSLSALIADIDSRRSLPNLSSYLRVAVLDDLRQKARAPTDMHPGHD